MKALIVSIGDELLIGQIINTNASWMARKCDEWGIPPFQIITLGDNEEELVSTLKKYENEDVYIFITGGLGPTSDDKTRSALARFLGVPLRLNEEALGYMKAVMDEIRRPITEKHQLQAHLPEGVIVLQNKMGTASGIWVERAGLKIIALPGVPYEMEYLMENQIAKRIEAGQYSIHKTILTVGMSESSLSERLTDFEDKLDRNIKLAYLPGLGQVRLRLTARGTDPNRLNQVITDKALFLKQILGDLVFGEDEDNLAGSIGKILMGNGWTVSTAESCTGGLISHKIVSNPGASDYFMGSIIAYSYEIKQNVLGVSESTLLQYGAVSEATVIEMVKGGLRILQTDFCIAVSGIAGPGGGTPEKPVGTIWIAAGSEKNIRTMMIKGGKDRIRNIDFAAINALNLLRKVLIDSIKEQ
jgi:nicotinamide-nucleotide amidase